MRRYELLIARTIRTAARCRTPELTRAERSHSTHIEGSILRARHLLKIILSKPQREAAQRLGVAGRLEPLAWPSDHTTEIHKGLHPRRRPFLFRDNSGCRRWLLHTTTSRNSVSCLDNETSSGLARTAGAAPTALETFHKRKPKLRARHR